MNVYFDIWWNHRNYSKSYSKKGILEQKPGGNGTKNKCYHDNKLPKLQKRFLQWQKSKIPHIEFVQKNQYNVNQKKRTIKSQNKYIFTHVYK